MTRQGRIPADLLRRLRTADRRAQVADRKAAAAYGELRGLIAEALAEGGSIRVVAAELGRSTRTIQKWLKEQDK